MEDIKQIRTAAATAGVHKPNGAAASIFEAGTRAAAAAGIKPARPPRRRLPPLDVANIRIVSGVPVPPAGGGLQAGGPYDDLLRKMQPGDMCELSPEHTKSLFSRAKVLGIKVTTRTLANGQVGVWRLAEA